MAKVLVAFFNGIVDEKNPEAMPAFYESFIKGLCQYGNSVFLAFHRSFGVDFGDIPDTEKRKIKEFNPDICIIFNNAYYDLSKVVDCPIVIIESDSLYISNRRAIKENPSRYYYVAVQSSSIKTVKEGFGLPESNIFFVPLFTEVQADENISQTMNISFIGSQFNVNHRVCYGNMIANLSDSDKEKYRQCMQEIRENPFVTKTQLVEKYKLQGTPLVHDINVPETVMMLSGERRLRVLSEVVDLGLVLYGTENWEKDYCYDSRINMAYVNKRVYSLQHNQDIYNASKIGISVSHLQARSGFPWRTMDIMASNACLVTDYHSDMEELFRGVNLPVYKDVYEAREICKRLLEQEDERKAIVKECQKIINSKYRFFNFLVSLEQCVGVKMQ